MEAKKTGPDASCRSDSGGGRKYRGPDSNRRPADYETVNHLPQTTYDNPLKDSPPVVWPTFGLRSHEAPPDTDLAAIVDAWSNLPPAARDAIMAVFRAVKP